MGTTTITAKYVRLTEPPGTGSAPLEEKEAPPYVVLAPLALLERRSFEYSVPAGGTNADAIRDRFLEEATRCVALALEEFAGSDLGDFRPAKPGEPGLVVEVNDSEPQNTKPPTWKIGGSSWFAHLHFRQADGSLPVVVAAIDEDGSPVTIAWKVDVPKNG